MQPTIRRALPARQLIAALGAVVLMSASAVHGHELHRVAASRSAAASRLRPPLAPGADRPARRVSADDDDHPVAAVPEPGTVALMAAGLIAVAGAIRKIRTP